MWFELHRVKKNFRIHSSLYLVLKKYDSILWEKKAFSSNTQLNQMSSASSKKNYDFLIFNNKVGKDRTAVFFLKNPLSVGTSKATRTLKTLNTFNAHSFMLLNTRLLLNRTLNAYNEKALFLHNSHACNSSYVYKRSFLKSNCKKPLTDFMFSQLSKMPLVSWKFLVVGCLFFPKTFKQVFPSNFVQAPFTFLKDGNFPASHFFANKRKSFVLFDI